MSAISTVVFSTFCLIGISDSLKFDVIFPINHKHNNNLLSLQINQPKNYIPIQTFEEVKDFSLVEYIPENESRHKWSEIFSVVSLASLDKNINYFDSDYFYWGFKSPNVRNSYTYHGHCYNGYNAQNLEFLGEENIKYRNFQILKTGFKYELENGRRGIFYGEVYAGPYTTVIFLYERLLAYDDRLRKNHTFKAVRDYVQNLSIRRIRKDSLN
jgi:hypothetical protein